MNPPSRLEEVRSLVQSRAAELNITLTEISRALDKNAAYMHQYINKKSPKKLHEDDRRTVEKILSLDENSLRVIPLTAPIRSISRAKFNSYKSDSSVQNLTVFQPDEIMNSQIAGQPLDLMASPRAAFGVWVHAPAGRLRAGDLILIHPTKPPRVGDSVVVTSIDDNRILSLGDLTSLSADAAMIDAGSSHSVRFSIREVRLHKVIEIHCA